MIKFLLLLFAVLAILGSERARVRSRRARSPRERSLIARMLLFSWVLAAVFLAAFIFLPNKQRVLVLAPASLAGVAVFKAWKSASLRVREAARTAADLHGMKRVAGREL